VPGPQPLLDAANRTRARVITIRPWGVADPALAAGLPEGEWAAYLQATQASLRRLALETGGTTVFVPEDVDPVLQRFAKP